MCHFPLKLEFLMDFAEKKNKKIKKMHLNVPLCNEIGSTLYFLECTVVCITAINLEASLTNSYFFPHC